MSARAVAVLVFTAVSALACTCGDLVEAPSSGAPEAEEPPEAPGDRRPRRGRGDRADGRPGTPEAPADPPAEPDPALDRPSDPVAAPTGPAPAPAGIRQVADDRWEVERALVDAWVEDPARLGDVVQDGEGWRLRKVREGDAYHLGMRNGDVITAVNGYPLGSTVEVALAWAALQDADRITVKFVRGGATLRHHYVVR